MTFDRRFPPFLPPFAPPGFSLVEVMLALSISALGFLTMLGLLPHGLQLVRDSADIAAEARIRQKLSGELLTGSWQQLDWTGFGPARCFTDQGIELTGRETAANAAGDLPVSYVASVQIPPEALDVRLPAAGQPQAPEPFLRRVKICIATSTDRSFDFATAPPRRVRSYTAVVAKTGE